MTRKSSEIIEDLVDSLEAMIDNMDDAWSCDKEGSWREADTIRSTLLPRSKERYKQLLDEYIDRRIETYLNKKGVFYD